jgi:dihydroflavonol-4-reductase
MHPTRVHITPIKHLVKGEIMKAFVTGATGLLGNNLVRLLVAQGHEVKALVRSKEKAQKLLDDVKNVEFIQGDMENVVGFAEALQGCDVLFHTAAYFREYYQPGDHWPMLEKINVKGTIELLESAEKHNVKKAIHVSSSGVIGEDDKKPSGDETSTASGLALENLYFRSKVETEKAIASFLKTHTMPVVMILPGWMFGPGDAAPTSAGQLVQDFLNRKLPGVLKGGAGIADARDVARAMLEAIEKGKRGERYIVGGKLYTLAEIMKTLEKVSGVPGPKLHISTPIALTIAWLSQTIAKLTGGTTLLTVSSVKTVLHPHSISSEKASHELGATFRPLEDTLRDTVNWYKSNSANQHVSTSGKTKKLTS